MFTCAISGSIGLDLYSNCLSVFSVPFYVFVILVTFSTPSSIPPLGVFQSLPTYTSQKCRRTRGVCWLFSGYALVTINFQNVFHPVMHAWLKSCRPFCVKCYVYSWLRTTSFKKRRVSNTLPNKSWAFYSALCKGKWKQTK